MKASSYLQKDNELEWVPLFAYGTLRTYQPLHDWVEDLIIERHTNVYGLNSKLYVSHHLFFPYLVKEEGSATRGELFVVKNNQKFADLVDMEIGAGYKMETIETNLGMNAVTFFCDLEKVFLVSPINCDDWVEFKEWTVKNKIHAV